MSTNEYKWVQMRWKLEKFAPNRGFRFKQLQPLPGPPKLLEAWLSPDSGNDSRSVERFNPKMPMFSWTCCDKILRPNHYGAVLRLLRLAWTDNFSSWPNLEWLGELYASMQRPCLWPVSWVSWSLAQFHRRHVAHGIVMHANTYKWIQESLGAFNAFKCFHIFLSQASASPRLPWPQSQKVRQTAWIEQQPTWKHVRDFYIDNIRVCLEIRGPTSVDFRQNWTVQRGLGGPESGYKPIC